MKREIPYSCFSVVIAAFLFIFLSPNSHSAENNYELYIAQGMEQLNDRQYNDALELFKKALAMAPDDTEAQYYTAITYTRLGELDKAETLFLKIKEPDSAPNVNFELGRIYYVKAECVKAENYLTKFISGSDDDSLKNYADSLIKDCRQTEAEAAKEEKAYRLNVTAGVQYDDNVTVEPQNPIQPENRRKDDGALIVYLDTGGNLYNKGTVKLKVDYSFYHNFHFDLDDYDVQYHKISPYVEVKVSDIITPSAGYSYEHTLFGGDRYSRINTFFAGVNIKEAADFSTDLVYRYRDLDYDDTALFTGNSIRSGDQNVLGVVQNLKIDKVNANVYYYNDHTRADADYWAYNGHKLGAEAVYQVMTPMYVTVSGQYSSDRYRSDFPGFSAKRKDRARQVSLILTYRISDTMTLYLTEDYTNNASNLNTFEYNRNVVGLLFTVALL